MWIPAQTTVPPGDRAQRHRDERTHRREEDRRVERLGRRSRAAAPSGAEQSAKRWAAASPGRMNANTRRPWWTATWAMMCAAAPKP